VSRHIRLAQFLIAVSLIISACVSATTPVPLATPTGIAPALSVIPELTETPVEALPRPVPPVFGEFDPATVNEINLADFPVLPVISPTVRVIYQAGLARGHNPHVFAKLGDSMTDNLHFLVPLSEGDYDLGEYGYLQEVIDQFAGVPARGEGWTLDSFATIGLAAAQGFNVAGPLDPTWANPQWCEGGESPVACDYRVSRPSLAVIMFGTNDVAYTEPAAYDFYLRTLIIETLNRDIVPILNTFPTRSENLEKARLLNQIVVRIAADYGIPLVNLNRALEPLPNYGVDPADPLHLLVPADGRVTHFTEANLQAGATVRNLITLRALYAVLQAVK